MVKMSKSAEVACAVVGWVIMGVVVGTAVVWMMLALGEWVWGFRLVTDADGVVASGVSGAVSGVMLVVAAWMIAKLP